MLGGDLIPAQQFSKGANMQKYRVRIFTRNAFLVFRGKKLRTPVECKNVFEHELPVLKLQIVKDALKHEIMSEADVEEKLSEPLVIEKRDKDVKVEELYDPGVESNSIMDKLISEEKANEA